MTLKKCPFCGNDASYVGRDEKYVRCNSLGCYGANLSTKWEWNERKIESDLIDKINRMQKELEFMCNVYPNNALLTEDYEKLVSIVNKYKTV